MDGVGNIKEYQIAGLLRVANEQLAYCNLITEYPGLSSKKNFDPLSAVDQFYKSVCNVFFHDSLLIISSLLDSKDSRVIGLWNWKDFTSYKSSELKLITDSFNNGPLKTIRDQLIAHQDVSNPNNQFPDSRRTGIIKENLIMLAQSTLDSIINEFCDYAQKFSTPYSEQYFDTEEAKNQLTSVMRLAVPTLTNNDVI
ncbi:MAG: hypothetical protein K8Q91_01240 [Candidatus Vogelbacteria bacterium]|nr:hypothetical protein [Candidatus Vogelbacteria bacterium]